MTALRVQFIHGLEGSPQGAKARVLAESFDALTPVMDTSDFEGCVEIHAGALRDFRPDVLVGSSFGGAVAVELLARELWSGPTLLLAQAALRRNPAAKLPEGVTVWLVHGTRDALIDPEDSRRLAGSGAPERVRLIEVDDDHPLHESLGRGLLPDWVRALARAASAVALLLAALQVACSPGDSAPPPLAPGEERRFSLLAIGDTGKNRPFGLTSAGQLAVGQALERHHLRAPVDALLLLGDNFYDAGLGESTLESQLRANLVRPYCAFLRLDGACSAAVAGACARSPAQRRPVPVYAVLGNHDYGLAESPKLQRERVPCYLPGWHVPLDAVETLEPAEGLSLVIYDSVVLEREGYAQLSEALRSAAGPWRIVAAHHPIEAGEPGRPVLAAIRAAGVPVQLHLAGHEHNLQLGRVGPDLLQVVSGAGSEGREVRIDVLGRDFVALVPGFARVDLVAGGAGERLEVSVYAASRIPLAAWSGSRLLERRTIPASVGDQ